MSKTSILIHVVFGTKFRKSILLAEGRERLYCYMAGVVKNNKSHLCAIGGYTDHIHILLDLHPSVALSSLVKELKTASNAIIKKERFLNTFESWADGYYAGSISPSHKRQCEEYIRNQESHHQTTTLENEMQIMASKYGLTYHKNDWE